jgi:hypothetical protein
MTHDIGIGGIEACDMAYLLQKLRFLHLRVVVAHWPGCEKRKEIEIFLA